MLKIGMIRNILQIISRNNNHYVESVIEGSYLPKFNLRSRKDSEKVKEQYSDICQNGSPHV